MKRASIIEELDRNAAEIRIEIERTHERLRDLTDEHYRLLLLLDRTKPDIPIPTTETIVCPSYSEII